MSVKKEKGKVKKLDISLHVFAVSMHVDHSISEGALLNDETTSKKRISKLLVLFITSIEKARK